MDKKSCTVCFFDIEDNEPRFTCADTKCKLIICQDCIHALVQYSKNENLLPKCPSLNCNGIYIISDIFGKVPNEVTYNYEVACFNYFMKNDGDTAKKKVEEGNMIKKLREERLKFLELNFPKGIGLVARITFKDKMRKLDKQKKEIISLKLREANKPCFYSMCNGFLDPDYVCMSCSTEFCKKCEKKKDNSHSCKAEDLESINIINGMVQCPGCKIPVFKNEGCDSITCAHCNTNFIYSTGKEGGHGSINKKININLHKKEKLSTILAGSIPEDCFQIVLEIESHKPQFVSRDTLLGPIEYYIRTGKKEGAIKRLSRRIDVYMKAKYANRDYQENLVMAEKMLTNKQDPHVIKKFLIDFLRILL